MQNSKMRNVLNGNIFDMQIIFTVSDNICKYFLIIKWRIYEKKFLTGIFAPKSSIMSVEEKKNPSNEVSKLK